MSLSFENTSIAYADKTDKEIRRAYILFRLIGYPFMVKMGSVLTPFALKIHLPIVWIFKPTVFKHFCGGESINQCHPTITKLNGSGIGTILDYAAEGMASEEVFDKTTEEVIQTIHKAHTDKAIPFAVFKVTGIGRFAIMEKIQNGKTLSDIENQEYKRLAERFDKICHTAFTHQVQLFVDAEETWIQNVIDRLTEKAMEKYNKEKAVIFNTVQMYRTDRLSYMESLIGEGQKKRFKTGFKIVRGAYMEKERERAAQLGYTSPIHTSKENTDTDYNKSIALALMHINEVSFCVATHNEESCLLLSQLMTKANLPNNYDHIYTAQLLGMSDNISYNMAAGGYNVAKYVPYGAVKTVIPYLIRRARENTSVAGQSSRELNLIKKEWQRRKTNRKQKK